MVGVNVAVYVVPLPEKLDIAPFVTVISPTTKSVVTSDEVNVNAIEESLVVDPEETVELEIVIVGTTLSYVQLNSSATTFGLVNRSVNVPAATFIVVAPAAAGVNIAV